MDTFDRLPDDVVVRILDLVSDVRTLARCRCLNRRIAALVSHAQHLHVAVVSPSSSAPPFFYSSPHTGSGLMFLLVPLLHRLLFSLLNSISALLYDHDKPPPVPFGTTPADDARRRHHKGSHTPSSSSSSPALLRGFHRVRTLRIELPPGDRPRITSKAAAAAVLRWRAVFGNRLRTCVILAARSYGPMPADEDHADRRATELHDDDSPTALKERVIWTIGALIAASASHHMAREMALGDKGDAMEELLVADRDGEGVVLVGNDGLREWRIYGHGTLEDDDLAAEETKGRTTIPAVRMTMRHARRVDLGGGVAITGAALVVVRAVGEASQLTDDKALVEQAFKSDGVFLAAAQQILNRPTYLLEMNSF